MEPARYRNLVVVGASAAALLFLSALLLVDRHVVTYIHETASTPNLLFTLLATMGAPIPHVAASGFVSMFCAIVRMNTGFAFSELFILRRAACILAIAVACRAG